ncbi:hypothetical protein KR51_00018740 [Rubidibacter lacunae KORDI 51-2]|uniref:Uncharacterized protein n=1 Tax=Rubidibacter lacunae KORDI 51-2 TaxID=582515 RepID=U5DIM1_9CHRO|nr:hypothetical protein KR51_00018740 [Rubidibacter lacunae KORDI 51-2]
MQFLEGPREPSRPLLVASDLLRGGLGSYLSKRPVWIAKNLHTLGVAKESTMVPACWGSALSAENHHDSGCFRGNGFRGHSYGVVLGDVSFTTFSVRPSDPSTWIAHHVISISHQRKPALATLGLAW